MMPIEFHQDLWCEETRVRRLSYGVVSVILRLAVGIDCDHCGVDHDQRGDDYYNRFCNKCVEII